MLIRTKPFRRMLQAAIVGSLCVFTVSYSATQNEDALEAEQLMGALYCLTTETAPGGGMDLKRFGDPLKVRYVYGVHDPAVDKPNSLHLMIFSKDKKSAVLWEMLVPSLCDERGYVIYNVTSFKMQSKKWIVDAEQSLGGLYTYERVQKLADLIATKKEVEVPRKQVRDERTRCNSTL